MDIASVMSYISMTRTRTWQEVLCEYPTYKEKLEKLYYNLMHCEKKLNINEEKAKEIYDEIFEHPMMEYAYNLRDEDAYSRKIKFQRRRVVSFIK